ncbi:osmotically inducible protein C [Bacillus sp. FJAT-18017]|uniref:OsmC family protein n=1 Tax=Bacillus sp. FJAT-18017 TaxID=1705566 RepID=UPI0006ADBC93|nr:OsmC family protein [Bacillus sp. FJAT-18017]ALC92976.1 osmotically inducible protein C [Bacillus sp. FJAT-18017]
MEFFMKEEGFYGDLPYGRLDVSGKDGAGHRPYQLMVASIAVCSGGVLRKILTKKRIDIEDIKIQAEVDRADGGTGKIERIHIHYIIRGRQLDETQIQKAIDVAAKNCPMAQSVAGSITIKETFELLSS